MQWLQDVTIRDESTLEVRPNINQKDQPYFAIKHLMEELPQVVIKVSQSNHLLINYWILMLLLQEKGGHTF